MEWLSASLAGTIFGFLAKTGYDYLVRKNERKDKYVFSLLTKRFEVHQEANTICEKLKKVVHDKTDEHSSVLREAREWYSKNHLYFTPKTRDEFNRLINDVQFYGVQLEDYFLTCNDQGRESEESKKKHTDLILSWDNIMKNTQRNIESDLDFYYEKIK